MVRADGAPISGLRWLAGLCAVMFAAGAQAVEVRFDVAGAGLPEDLRSGLESVMVPVQIKDVTQDLANTRLLAESRLNNALQVFGYYHPEFQWRMEFVNENRYIFHYTIKPGPRVQVTRVSLDVNGPGADLPAVNAPRSEFPLKPGEPLRQDVYEKAKAQWLSAAQNEGYIDADFSRHEILLDRGKNVAEINLSLQTGPRFVFGETQFNGAGTYPEDFLGRYVAYEPGDVFSYDKLSQTQYNFLGANRFGSANVLPDREAARDNVVPVQVNLVPLKPKRFKSGVGYGTDTGGRLTARYEDVNFRHSANELYLQADVAQMRQGFAGRFVWPSYQDLHAQTAVYSSLQRESVDTYTTRFFNLGVERTRHLGNGVIGTASLTYRNEIFQLGLQRGHSILILPALRARKQNIQDPLRPRRGYQFDGTLNTSATAWGSDADFIQFSGRGETWLPFNNATRVALRTNVGATWQHNATILALPPSLRFFAGGDRSVRGYDYQSQGPRDASGAVIGGRHLLTGSMELQRDIGSLFGAVLFYDAGNAFDNLAEFNVLQSVGIGARVYSPVGPIRLDVAHPVGDPTARDFRIHFSAGATW